MGIAGNNAVAFNSTANCLESPPLNIITDIENCIVFIKDHHYRHFFLANGKGEI